MMETCRNTLGLFLVFLVCVNMGFALESPPEYRLISTLLSEYDVNARPVLNPNHTVRVDMRISLVQIHKLDEVSQVLTASFWMSWHWKDVSLQWQPQDYSGIQRVRIATNRLWRPDITLTNDVSSDKQHIEDYHAIVSSDGSVDWYFPAIYQSSCMLDITYFPWDQQNCRLEFSSWTYDVTKIDFYNRSAAGNLGYFVGDGVWVVRGFPVERLVETYVETISSLIYTLQLQRKPLYYIYNLILPCMFITLCGLLVFLLPPDCGEKVSMAVTMLLSATVFLVVFSESMPVQSDVIPTIGIFFIASIFLLVMSTVLSILVLCLHHRGGLPGVPPRVPRPVRRMVLGAMASALCMRATVSSSLVRSAAAAADEIQDGSSDKCGADASDGGGGGGDKAREREEKTANHKHEWILTAMVLDRFFFIVFVIAMTVCSCTILLYKP